MSATQHTLAEYFPTEPWLEKYRTALEEGDDLAESGQGWGAGWEGAMVFEITDVPVDDRTVADLPAEIREQVTAPIRSLPEEKVESVLEAAPADVREAVEARDGSLRERAIAELETTVLQDAPDRLWPDLTAEHPEMVVQLLAQLDESVTADRSVYAWLDVHDVGCREVAVLDERSDRDRGFVIVGAYEQWRRLVDGDGEVISMIMSGDLELEGDMQKLLEYTQAATDLVDTAVELDSKFLL